MSSHEKVPILPGKTVFWVMVGLAVAVLLIALVWSAQDRKDWEASLAYYPDIQQAIAEGDYERGLELLNSMSPGYRESSYSQLLIGSCYAGMAEQVKLEEQENDQLQEYLQLAKTHLIQARNKNFHLIDSQGYVNGYARILMDLGEYEAAYQYFLQSIKLDTYPEFTSYAQSQLQMIPALMGEGDGDE